MSAVTLDAGPGAATCTPQARLRVVPADPAEVERLRALHHVPRCQRNRRPWLNNQAALMDPRGRNPQPCPPAAAMTALRLARLDLEELVVSADHEFCGDRGSVRAGPQVGDVALPIPNSG
jgi:hypothetical protein